MLLFLGFPFGIAFFAPPAYSPLSLSPLVSSLGGQSCSPPSLVAPVVFALGEFLSVAAVLYLLLPTPATGVVSSCYSHLWPLVGPGTCFFLGFTLGSSLSLPVLAAGLRWLRFILSCPPSVASLRWLFPGSWSGTCWLAIAELLCLWPPGFYGVPSLHVRSPVSGTVCVLPQSTIVTLLSLLWLGLLWVFVRFHCLGLTLWASA